MPACAACGMENVAGRKFCGGCGVPLARACPACGSPNEPDMRFCGECGGPLDAEAAAPPAPAAAERRLVSVLFADLVGFTPLSESRDPEEVRELLSRYFDQSRRLIEIYGGTVEKFIGDAVMAAWGTPVAQEDDAERAVRAALDLVAAVAQLGEEIGAPDLRARAGVLTGEAAVTLHAHGESMVAGDLVNTASRVQSAAEPGTVLVGDSTKRASDAAIAYEAAGTFELKGKSQPVQLFRATRVMSVRGGAMRTGELEPPFVGRRRELSLVKELFHETSEEHKAHLISVIGIAGIGKSRLAWEFEKYLDGVAEEVYWHRGRCLAYGNGVAYWALAEMVRMRALVAEDDAPEEARDKLHVMLERWIADEGEREWIEPRLAHLIGVSDSGGDDRQSLFSAWRLLFERLAANGPVVLVFEDIQWADAGLLDFVEHVLDWSRAHPIFVLALARPELAERRPGFGSGGRNATTLSLEPLPERAMRELLDGFVPGLPDELRERILQRAEGVPLYAVETVRMLLDRGLLARDGDVYRPTGPIGDLDVPETLHALVAARLDGLAPDERRALQDAAVLGKSFTKPGLAALSGLDDAALDQVLASLIRKEVLSVQADPRSPERGQYTFLQDLLKRIAYETLSRADRKSRHLAAAAHLERTQSSDHDLVEVIAAHYVDAYDALPDASDAAELRAAAAERLVQAAERAASLAANDEARGYFERAAALADDDLARARLLERAGTAAFEGARHRDSIALLDHSIELYEAVGSTHAAAHATAQLGLAMWRGDGDIAGAAERLTHALDVLADDEPDEEIAALVEMLARLTFFLSDHEGASERTERALEIAEALGAWRVLSNALNTKSLLLAAKGRYVEAAALLAQATAIARAQELPLELQRALNNGCVALARQNRFAEMLPLAREGVELARRAGLRELEQQMLSHVGYSAWMTGDWETCDELAGMYDGSGAYPTLFRGLTAIYLALPRGQAAEARRALDEMSTLRDSSDRQLRGSFRLVEAMVLLAEGRARDALTAAREAHQSELERSWFDPLTWRVLLEAAAETQDAETLEEALARRDELAPVERTWFVEALYERFHARLMALRGDAAAAAEELEGAAARFAAGQAVFFEAMTLVDLAEIAPGRGDDRLQAARETLVRLGATPWVERIDALQAPVPVAP